MTARVMVVRGMAWRWSSTLIGCQLVWFYRILLGVVWVGLVSSLGELAAFAWLRWECDSELNLFAFDSRSLVFVMAQGFH